MTLQIDLDRIGGGKLWSTTSRLPAASHAQAGLLALDHSWEWEEQPASATAESDVRS